MVLVDGNSLKLFDGIVESLVGPGGGFVEILADLQMPIVDVGYNPANGHLDVLGLNCLKGFDESGNPLGIVGETLQEPALYRAVTRLNDGCIVISNVLGEGALHKYDGAGSFLRNLDAADWPNTIGLANDPTDGKFSAWLAVSSGRLTVRTALSLQKST